MITFALDSSQSGVCLAVIQDEKIIAAVTEQLPAPQSALLLKKTDELFHQAGVAVADVAEILFCNGPGSFTSLRVAWATLVGLFYDEENTSRRLMTCSSLLLRCLSVRAEPTEDVVVLMRAGRARIYYGELIDDAFAEKAVDLSEAEKILAVCNQSLHLAGDGLSLLGAGILDRVTKNGSITPEDVLWPEGFLEILRQGRFQVQKSFVEAKLSYLMEPDIG